jgi:hypothetical protein
LLEPVQCRIQRALTDLQNLTGKLANALRDSPTVHWLQRNSLQNKNVERPLNEICGLSHESPVNE